MCVQNLSEAIFSYFLSQGKDRFLSKKSAIFLQFFYFRFFLPKIVSNSTENRFFAEKSAEKTIFLSFIRVRYPIITSLSSFGTNEGLQHSSSYFMGSELSNMSYHIVNEIIDL